jgi:hypothetical protein
MNGFGAGLTAAWHVASYIIGAAVVALPLTALTAFAIAAGAGIAAGIRAERRAARSRREEADSGRVPGRDRTA